MTPTSRTMTAPIDAAPHPSNDVDETAPQSERRPVLPIARRRALVVALADVLLADVTRYPEP